MKTDRRRLLQSAVATGAGLTLGGHAVLGTAGHVSAQSTGTIDDLRARWQRCHRNSIRSPTVGL